MKLQAKTRLQASWWDDMSDLARRAYLKIHPNSKMGRGGSAPAPAPSAKDEHAAAEAEARRLHEQIEKKGGRATDKEWAAYDVAQDRLSKATDRLKKGR